MKIPRTRPRGHSRRLAAAPILLAGLLLSGLVLSASAARADLAGKPSRVHALTGATLVTGPGADPFHGTVILRDGRIEMVGVGVDVPPGAIVHDLTGRTIYAGWIEPYLPLPRDDEAASGTSHENPRVHPEVRAQDRLPLPEETRKKLREAGYTLAQAVPPSGIFRGATAVVSLGDGDPAARVLRGEHAQAFAFERGAWTKLSYPNSLMGAIALARQTLLDARWNRDTWDAWARSPDDVERPEESASLRALRPLLDRAQPIVMEVPSVADLLRASSLAREFRLHPVFLSRRPEHARYLDRVVRALDDSRGELVLGLGFPEAPRWDDEEAKADVDLSALREWETAPGDPAALEEAGIPFSATAFGLDSPGDARARLRTAIARGLSEREALACVTTRPAALLGVGHRVGTIEPGKDADLLVATGPIFAPGTRIEEVWVDGERYGEDERRAVEGDVTRKWELWLGDDAEASDLAVRILAKDRKMSGVVEPDAASGSGDDGTEDDAGSDAEQGTGSAAGDSAAADEPATDREAEPDPRALADVTLERGVLSFRIPASAWERGPARVELRRDGPFLRGQADVGGVRTPVLARPAAKGRRAKEEEGEILSLLAPAWPPEADTKPAPSVVLVRNATIWTCSGAGVLEGADLLVKSGRIVDVGRSLDAPGSALVIDGTGMHVTPGLIDCHSHSSIEGGVNECTQSCTAEVRIADVVDANSSAIYRELAGGLTVSNLLHGSCNPMGGQNAVIKLRWGAPAEDLLFAGAPGGIKFALGENVTRSNWDTAKDRDRYPNTRMGVEQFLRERFSAAEDYRRAWDEWRASKAGPAPRRDLELDTLVEILQGDRLVHCHSYRADEIIMLIRVADDFGFRVGTFQHVLEGYKAANEIATHGAGASAFSDWWAYKYEVVDAIPYNGEIMWRRGVVVSFNSDSAELSRRMNLEAAKAVKYGGVPEAEALKFVTLNPAIQLGIDGKVGSLEAGKDADFVLWSAHPLSDFAVCRQTWIDGVKRFDIDEDHAAREAAAELREKLLAKAEKAAAASPAGDKGKRGGQWWQGGDGGVEMPRGECVEVQACCGGAGH